MLVAWDVVCFSYSLNQSCPQMAPAPSMASGPQMRQDTFLTPSLVTSATRKEDRKAQRGKPYMPPSTAGRASQSATSASPLAAPLPVSSMPPSSSIAYFNARFNIPGFALQPGTQLTPGPRPQAPLMMRGGLPTMGGPEGHTLDGRVASMPPPPPPYGFGAPFYVVPPPMQASPQFFDQHP